MARKPTNLAESSKTPRDPSSMQSSMTFEQMVSEGQELALADAMQNLKVRANRHLIKTKDFQTR